MIEVYPIAHGSKTYNQTVELRRRVLRQPLGLDFSDEELVNESDEYHFAALNSGDLVGCLILVPSTSGEVKMRQVAIEPAVQGKGIGTLLVEESERFARSNGYTKMTLHARETAVPFYERLGYTVVGDVFEEVTIPHYRMSKSLER